MSKHTPGPWKVMYSTPRDGECALAVWPQGTIEGTVGSPICKVSPEISENETDRANARLIAAAPELLDALTKAVQVIKAWHQADDVFGIYYNRAPEMKPIRDAIAKATGEKEETA